MAVFTRTNGNAQNVVSVIAEESAWNTTDLKANIDAALQAGGYNVSVTVTNVGLKLATS